MAKIKPQRRKVRNAILNHLKKIIKSSKSSQREKDEAKRIISKNRKK